MQPKSHNRILTPSRANSAIVSCGEYVREIKNLRIRQSVLLQTALFKGDAPPSITHFAIGSGIGTGTLTLPQDPVDSATRLRAEIHRQAVGSIAYHDTSNTEGDTITDGTRSNKLLISTTVLGADSDNLITEAAIFGGTGAANENGGDMIAWITFPVIDNRAGGQNPNAPEDLTFSWILEFPLVNLE